MKIRKQFEMTEAQLAKIIEACKPVPYMIVGGHAPRSPQENANDAWCRLGDEMGFDGMTVRPDGRGDRFFTAEEKTPTALAEPITECHGLDTPERVCFYEQDFYVLSNFSAFNLDWKGVVFHTSEAAYHSEKFDFESKVFYNIRHAPSAHEAFKIAERNKAFRRPDWDDVKVAVMRDILRAKADQHEYVRRKLLATGERELVENSWRDDYWGWGPNRDGKNMLGKLWMEVRTELRAKA